MARDYSKYDKPLSSRLRRHLTVQSVALALTGLLVLYFVLPSLSSYSMSALQSIAMEDELQVTIRVILVNNQDSKR